MKEIQLTQGKVTQVDDEDYEWLNQWKWCAAKGRNTFYAIRTMINNGHRHTTRMHRFILNAPIGIDIDHRDCHGLNNQRYNLRPCTIQQNQMNQVSCATASSIFKGVSWCKKSKVWVSYIYNNYKRFHLGSFKSEIEAAKKYDEAALNLFGEFARTNFN